MTKKIRMRVIFKKWRYQIEFLVLTKQAIFVIFRERLLAHFCEELVGGKTESMALASSRNFMDRGGKIEFTAVEEDSGAVVEGVAEATGIGLEGLYFGVERRRWRW